jgi:DNA-binding protein H-NS
MELTRKGAQVNENRRGTALPFDFSELPEEELELIIKTAEKEIERRKEVKREIALHQVLAAAQEAGMTPEELLRMATEAKGGRRRHGGGKRGAIAWRHPDDPGKVYRGGKKPEWLKELKEKGREPVKVE